MRSEIIDIPSPVENESIQDAESQHGEIEKPGLPERQDAFGDETNAEIKYKVLKWWYVIPILIPPFPILLIWSPGKEVF
jgi:hypothetical protein